MITFSELYLKSIFPFGASEFAKTKEFISISNKFNLFEGSWSESKSDDYYDINFMLLAGTLAHTDSLILYNSDRSLSEIGKFVLNFIALDADAGIELICGEAHNLFSVLISEWEKGVLKTSKVAEVMILELWDVQNLCLIPNSGNITIDGEKIKIPISRIDFNIDLCVRFPLLWLNNICYLNSSDFSEDKKLNHLDKIFYLCTEEIENSKLDVDSNAYPIELCPWLYRAPLRSILLNI